VLNACCTQSTRPDKRAKYSNIQRPPHQRSQTLRALLSSVLPIPSPSTIPVPSPASSTTQWLRFTRPLPSLLISIFLPFFVLSRLKNPWRRLRTMCDGLYVSRGPQRIWVPANAAEAEILPTRSSVSGDVGVVEGAPGAASVHGDERDSIGRRAFRRDMLRALFLSAALF
jgi:hypothetical protein